MKLIHTQYLYNQLVTNARLFFTASFDFTIPNEIKLFGPDYKNIIIKVIDTDTNHDISQVSLNYVLLVDTNQNGYYSSGIISVISYDDGSINNFKIEYFLVD